MRSLFAIILLCSLSPAEGADSIWPCLPKDVTQDTLVSSQELESARGKTQEPVTVRDALRSLEAPDFSLPDVAGRMHALSDHRGKKVLLVTWASW
jgi:hypothetical protein